MTNKYLFDSTDKKIFEFLKSVRNTNSASADDLILNAHLHPHGIKELMEPKQLRVAKSILRSFMQWTRNRALINEPRRVPTLEWLDREKS